MSTLVAELAEAAYAPAQIAEMRAGELKHLAQLELSDVQAAGLSRGALENLARAEFS